MKAALIGDVHGNLPALEAVLEHARREDVGHIWNTGDFVGYGPFPEEVVKAFRKIDAKSVAGNYDLKALQFPSKAKEWEKGKKPDKYTAFKFAYEQLSTESRDYLRGLPHELRIETKGRRILLVHGSPLSIKEHIAPDTSDARLRELYRAAKADVIIFGHSHIPLFRELDGVYFINPGSVGRPDDGDPRASYAILQMTSKTIQVKHLRVSYDVSRVTGAIRRHALPEAFIRMFETGRNYDDSEATFTEADPIREIGDGECEICVNAARALAGSHHFEEGHSRQVTRLALSLFDQLKPLHRLGRIERLQLECAAMLHDIGIKNGPKKHHKVSFDMIMCEPLKGFDPPEQLVIALVARYHRKSLPGMEQDEFSSLSPAEQEKVRALAAILRVADGLDRTHRGLVKAVTCEVSPKEITVRVASPEDAVEECQTAVRKGDLMRETFARELTVQCHRI